MYTIHYLRDFAQLLIGKSKKSIVLAGQSGMHPALLSYLNAITALSASEIDYLSEAFKPLHLKKGDFFQKQGQVNRYVGFLVSGLLRYFVIKKDEEATFEFTPEFQFVADYQSFNSRKPGIQNIQAIEDCYLFVIDYEHVQYVFRNFPNGNLLGRIIIENRFEIMVNQLLAIYLQSQEDRYNSFLQRYSELVQRIPLFMIASYVGVKPQSLSRIRSRALKKRN